MSILPDEESDCIDWENNNLSIDDEFAQADDKELNSNLADFDGTSRFSRYSRNRAMAHTTVETKSFRSTNF
jgi:hypothetical protein